jgi:hypothetical protein
VSSLVAAFTFGIDLVRHTSTGARRWADDKTIVRCRLLLLRAMLMMKMTMMTMLLLLLMMMMIPVLWQMPPPVPVTILPSPVKDRPLPPDDTWVSGGKMTVLADERMACSVQRFMDLFWATGFYGCVLSSTKACLGCAYTLPGPGLLWVCLSCAYIWFMDLFWATGFYDAFCLGCAWHDGDDDGDDDDISMLLLLY